MIDSLDSIAIAPQVLLESGSRATEFEDMVVDPGRKLLPDMMTDSSGEHLYTISSSKVKFNPTEN